ncbi:hypothetical protein Droror1_Dr00026598 [Drosera rotundifolia]
MHSKGHQIEAHPRSPIKATREAKPPSCKPMNKVQALKAQPHHLSLMLWRFIQPSSIFHLKQERSRKGQSLSFSTSRSAAREDFIKITMKDSPRQNPNIPITCRNPHRRRQLSEIIKGRIRRRSEESRTGRRNRKPRGGTEPAAGGSDSLRLAVRRHHTSPSPFASTSSRKIRNQKDFPARKIHPSSLTHPRSTPRGIPCRENWPESRKFPGGNTSIPPNTKPPRQLLAHPTPPHNINPTIYQPPIHHQTPLFTLQLHHCRSQHSPNQSRRFTESSRVSILFPSRLRHDRTEMRWRTETRWRREGDWCGVKKGDRVWRR